MKKQIVNNLLNKDLELSSNGLAATNEIIQQSANLAETLKTKLNSKVSKKVGLKVNLHVDTTDNPDFFRLTPLPISPHQQTEFFKVNRHHPQLYINTSWYLDTSEQPKKMFLADTVAENEDTFLYQSYSELVFWFVSDHKYYGEVLLTGMAVKGEMFIDSSDADELINFEFEYFDQPFRECDKAEYAEGDPHWQDALSAKATLIKEYGFDDNLRFYTNRKNKFANLHFEFNPF